MAQCKNIAAIKADIEKFEKALRDCTDGGMRRVIEYWLGKARGELANQTKSRENHVQRAGHLLSP
jgi:hypothetical protein